MSRPNSQDSPDRHPGVQPMDLRASAAGLINAFYKITSEEASRYDLTATEARLLRACYEWQGECTATELAKIIPIDTSRISRIVTIMVNRGLLIRRRQTDDRRIVMLRLSEEGLDLTSRMLKDMRQNDAILMEGIDDDEMGVFTSVSSRIIDNYAAMQETE